MNLAEWKNRKKGVSEEVKVRLSLKYSILDGTFYSTMVGFGESFFSAFAVLLEATTVHLGILGSLPQALGSIFQLFSEKLLSIFKSRKRLVCTGAFLQGLMLIPMMFLFLFGVFKIWMLIFFVSMYFIIGMIISPAWSSWMGDLVPEETRGRYFGKRNKITGFASFFALLIAGLILQQFADPTTKYYGFITIFSIAFIARLGSVSYLLRQNEPRFIYSGKNHIGLIEFVRQVHYTNYGLANYGWFVFYLCAVNFALYVANPFFTVYMLNDLKMSYWVFTIVTAAQMIVKYTCMPIWGKASDKYGTKRVLALTGFLIPFVPLLWMFSGSVFYLIFVQVYSGFVWAGFELASFNFLFDTVSSEHRANLSAYSNVLNGVAIFFGAVVGTILVKYNHSFSSIYFLVFFISFILRMLAAVIFIPRLKEVRQVSTISYSDLFLNVVTTTQHSLMHHTIYLFKGNHEKSKISFYIQKNGDLNKKDKPKTIKKRSS